MLFHSLLWALEAPAPTPSPTPVVERELDAIEKASLEPAISDEYKQGEHLIYDCRSHHYACVNDNSFDYCREKRENAFEQDKNQLPCAPLKKFKTQKECFNEQYKQIHQQKQKLFCINFKIKKVRQEK